MNEDKGEISEAERRRKRVKLYKRIIVIAIITIILLPTILCIILFCRMNHMQKEFSELRARIETASMLAEEESNDKASDDRKGQTSLNKNPSENTKETQSVQPETESVQPETETTQPETQAGEDIVEEALSEGRKVVYLTFDDGPSGNTEALLDVLAEHNVKATFFVNGHEGYENALNRIVKEGHTLALHTYTHDYAHVYESVDSFAQEVESLQDYLESTTGVRPLIFRFPGGSSNSKAQLPISDYIAYLNKHNMVYFDWNVSSGDGGDGLSSRQVYDNVMKGIAGQDVSVVLMHDATYRMTTFEAVPDIIEKLQEQNALILPITADTQPVHHNVN